MTKVTTYLAILAGIVLAYLLGIYLYTPTSDLFVLQLIFGGQIATVIVLIAIFLELLLMRTKRSE